MADNVLAQVPRKRYPTLDEQMRSDIVNYLSRLKSDFVTSGERAGQGLGQVIDDGNYLEGVPRVVLGGLGALSAPVSAAVSPVLGPLLQPVGEAVDTYVGQPVERATGYPADITNELFLTGVTAGAAPVLRPVLRGSGNFLAKVGDAAEAGLNRVGYTARPQAGTFFSGGGPVKLADDVAQGGQGASVGGMSNTGHAAKVSRLAQADTKRLSAIDQRMAELGSDSQAYAKAYQQALDAHNAGRPAGTPRNAWMDSFKAPEQIASLKPSHDEFIKLRSERKALESRMAKRDTLAPVRAAAELYADKVANMHKNQNLSFKAMTVGEYNAAPAVKVYKSPNYNGKQSSEYKVIMVDGRPAYARKSNHWGKFYTNIKDPKQAAAQFGISVEEAAKRAENDAFGRIGYKPHEWRLEGGKEGANNSQAGYVFLDE